MLCYEVRGADEVRASTLVESIGRVFQWAHAYGYVYAHEIERTRALAI